MMSEKKRVLILCTGNSARSQMAEGLLRHLSGDQVEVVSAGLEPSFVRPQAIEAMKEIGIDISHHRSKSVNELLPRDFDYVITVCDHANQRCPVVPGHGRRIHWSIDDPVGPGAQELQLDAFRRARDELRQRLMTFMGEL